jgi:hypothetical protein
MNHSSDNLCEIWHRKLGHLQYGGLPLLKDMVVRLLNFNVERIGVCKGSTLGKHVNTTFPSNENRSRRTLDLVHMCVDPCH